MNRVVKRLRLKIRRTLLALIAFFPNRLKIFLYSLGFGAQIGTGAKFGFGAVVLFEKMNVGPGFEVGRGAFIDVVDLEALNDFKIHRHSQISVYRLRAASRTTVGERTEIKGDRSSELSVIELGMYSWIFQDCYINVARPLKLSHNVGVGGGSYIFTHGYWLSELDGYPVKYGSVNIEQNVWLPWSCFIMPGVNIGAGSIVGARSVINRDVPAGVVVAGAPAKVVKEQSHKEMSMEDKVKLMAGWIRQFLKLKRLEYKELSSETMVQFVISEKEGFVLSLSPHPQWNSQFLNIVWDTPKVEDLKKYRVYSLNQSISSKERDLTSLEKSFFIYYRNSGLRYYPFDELAQSEQFIQQRGSDLG